jgi:hypothetical protein
LFLFRVTNNALPATLDIHKALREELGVDTRIGATFGQVYCGVVGGIRRHEFSVLGAAVNLAARLMESPMNKGILVDEAVKSQAGARFEFRSLQPVKAKGYDKPVSILEPLRAISSHRKRGTAVAKFTGRQEERNEILVFAREILNDPKSAQSSVITLIGESGIGKVRPECLSAYRSKHSFASRRLLCLLFCEERTRSFCYERSQGRLFEEETESHQLKIYQHGERAADTTLVCNTVVFVQ